MRIIGKRETVLGLFLSTGRVVSFLVLVAAALTAAQTATAQVIYDGPSAPPLVQVDVPSVREGAEPLSLARTVLYVRLVNTTSQPLEVELSARAITGGDDVTWPIQSLPIGPYEKLSVPLSTKFMPVNLKYQSFVSQLLLTGRIHDAAGRLLAKTRAPSLFYYRDAAGVLFVSKTLVNKGLVGPLYRQFPKEVMEIMSKSDSIGVGRPGLPPADPDVIRYTYANPGGRLTFGYYVQVCVTLKVNYTDNGFGEDFWTNNNDKSVPGVWATVRDSGNNIVFDGYTEDGYNNNDTPGGGTIECTPWIFTSNKTNWSVYVQSRAKVRGNNIDVFTTPNEENLYSWFFMVDELQSGQNFIPIPHETRQSSTLAAAAQTIFRHNGAMVTGNYDIHTGIDYITSFHAKSSHKIYMTDDDSRKKFIVVHEMGHSLLFERLGADFGVTDASHNAAAPCDSPIPNTHRMASKEFSLTAMHEGFANFLAVDVWNNHNEQDGVFVSWGEAYDADPPLGNIWMRYNCQSPYVGFGNETDWMRFFWDFHTGGVSPYNAVPFDEIVGLIDFASPLPTMGAYQGLAAAVQIFNQGVWSNEFFYWADMNGITY